MTTYSAETLLEALQDIELKRVIIDIVNAHGLLVSTIKNAPPDLLERVIALNIPAPINERFVEWAVEMIDVFSATGCTVVTEGPRLKIH